MKNKLTGFLLLLSFGAFAQVDSSKLNVTFRLSQGLWAVAFNENLIDITTISGESLYDKVKAPSRSGGSLSSQVSSDTVDANIPFLMSATMRGRPYAQISPYYTDINSEIRKATGPGAAWLNRQLDILDARDAAEVARRFQRGTGKLKRTQ